MTIAETARGIAAANRGRHRPRPPKIQTPMARARMARGLTLEQVGDLIDYSPRTLGAWERGENLPSWKSLQALAALYEVSIRDLIDEESRR